jgi:ubiquinone/menaquinone biosynthesis C-methylase UbiE
MCQKNLQTREREFWDKLAYKLEDSSIDLGRYEISAIRLLGELKGKRILDCGTGIGKSTIFLSKKGASVVGFDISHSLLTIANKKMKKLNSKNYRFFRMDVENLGFKAQKFDKVLGIHFLHHTSLNKSIPEISRILKKGGKCVFVENFSFNPLLNFFRKYVVGKFGIPRYGTFDEHPLTNKDLQLIKSYFKTIQLTVPEILFARLLARQVFRFKNRPINWICSILDTWISKGFKELRHYSYTQILVLKK